MGLRRTFREWKLKQGQRNLYRAAINRTLHIIGYHGIDVPLTGDHMIKPIVRQLLSGSYEMPEITALHAVVRSDDNVLELGTGLGIVTALAARAASKGKVLTFEANPILLSPAASLFAQNGISNVEARHGVIVDGPGGGTLPFYLNPSFAEGSLATKIGQVIEVPTWAAADILSSFRPNVLICDIEGAEGDLLPALDLACLRAAVVEFHPHILSRTAVAGIYQHMSKYGLYPAIEHSSGTVVAFERVEQTSP
jgi:FkbM family methyltransferase